MLARARPPAAVLPWVRAAGVRTDWVRCVRRWVLDGVVWGDCVPHLHHGVLLRYVDARDTGARA